MFTGIYTQQFPRGCNGDKVPNVRQPIMLVDFVPTYVDRVTFNYTSV